MIRAIIAGTITFVVVALIAHNFKKEENKIKNIPDIADIADKIKIPELPQAKILVPYATSTISSATIGPIQFCTVINNNQLVCK